ncbi:MAG: type I glutamate--ammonia ligase [bacterium]|nr:type I glutamate--ammonia ligase [bacterium]
MQSKSGSWTRRQHADAILKAIKEHEAEYVDFRFTDPKGTWHHLTFHKDAADQETLSDGLMFDGSSISGWKSIEDSDMALLPDGTRLPLDPFSAHITLIVFCNVHEVDGTSYLRDPRSIALKAEAYLKTTGIADEVCLGPEPEFFLFDEAHYSTGSSTSFYNLSSSEGDYPTGPWADREDMRNRNFGHRPMPKAGYFPVAPVDSGGDIRADMLDVINAMGLVGEKSHHEVAASQHELAFKYAGLVETADNLQIFKYAVRNVAHENGKTATFMPKPVYGDNGSGMHVHQSLRKNNQPLFLGEEYSDLSEQALHYIGGILKHAKSLNAFTNPTTNSYKRLVPGYEAPIYKEYSARNRSAAIRIPHVTNKQAKRIETRFPDPSANPYLCLSALMMAGLDGIENRIEPGEAMERNLYDAKQSEMGEEDTLCTSLQDALRALDSDRDFLKKGDVFTDDQIDAYIALKQEEINQFNEAPHPIEFQLYYSL